MKESRLEAGVLVVLGVAAIAAALAFHEFGRTRFFTVDEYQYGHATWLVAQGQKPYVDFFEHHFPLSYVLHAPLFTDLLGGGARPFDASALLLRRIVVVSWLLLCALTAWAGFRVTRSRPTAVLLALLPVGFGFSLLSAVDYRADNFAAIYFGACLALLEWNRREPSVARAAVAGLLAILAAGMTQKMAFVGGLSVAAMLAVDGLRRVRGAAETPFVARPLAFVLGAGIPGLVALATAGALGMLPAAFEATIRQAAAHEEFYEPFSVIAKGWLQPFWRETWPATVPTLALAALFLATREGRFWAVPLAASGLGALLITAPYPYNFVFPCWLVSVAAVRGFRIAVRALADRAPALAPVAPLLFLIPLVALLVQVRFVGGTTSNAHQLAVLRKIEAHGGRDATVIDSAGGAMFSPHASYYWYHGDAHRKMFRGYFESELARDYARSAALFWIRDARYRNLPRPVRDFLQRHYVHGGDGLHVLGARTPATGHAARDVELAIVRPGTYRFHPTRAGHRAEEDLRLNGVPPRGARLRLEAGVHTIRVEPGAPAYVVTPVAASFFDADPAPPRYSMMFEYAEPSAKQVQTVFDFRERLPVAPGADEIRTDAESFVQPGNSRLRFHAALPESPRLRGHVSLLFQGGRGRSSAERGRVRLLVRDDESEAVLVDEPLRDALRHPGRRIDASLSRWAGRMVEIELSFESAAGDATLRWSRLRIEGTAPDESDEGRDAISRGPANLLLVLVDTLRADRTEPYGPTRVRTPNLARLAAGGVTFADAQSNASWTAPSVASMLSAVYPAVHGISGTGWMRSEDARVTALHESLPYLPEILRDAGYRTAAIVKNPFFHQAFGFGRGFEEIHELYKRRREIRESLPDPEAQADAVWDEAIAPLAASDEPFFVYLHELDPHHPYDPLPPYDALYPAEWTGDKELLRKPSFGLVYRRNPAVLDGGGEDWLDSQYDGEVSFMDAYLGRLLARLDEAGLREETLVVFVSDHGEALADHGMVGHGGQLWDELLRVPWILSLPGRLPAGHRVDAPVELLDLAPTVLDLLGLEASLHPSFQGRSLVPLLEGAPPAEERARFAQAVFGQNYSYDSVRFRNWKLIRKNPTEGKGEGKEKGRGEGVEHSLYDLDSDPGEERDLWKERRVVGNTLRSMLEWRQRLDADQRVESTEHTEALSPEMRANLQALGYLE